jgi:hypothetical protein
MPRSWYMFGANSGNAEPKSERRTVFAARQDAEAIKLAMLVIDEVGMCKRAGIDDI